MAIGFTCVCGNSLRANERYAGLTARCPRCSALLTVPSKNPSLAPGTTTPSSSVLPRTARRRKVVWRTGSIALALAFILGLAAACFMKARAKPSVEKVHLDLIPRDAAAFGTCRLSALWPELLQDESFRSPGIRIEEECHNHLGLPPGDIERFTLVLPYADSQPIVFVTASNPVDEDDVATLVAPDARTVRHGNAAYQLAPNGTAISFIDPKTYVFGAEQDVEHWLDRAESPTSSGPLASALDRAARDEDHLFAAVAMSRPLRRRISRSRPDNSDLHALTDFQDGMLIANFDSTCHYSFQASYSSPDKALEAQQKIGVIQDGILHSNSKRPRKSLMPPLAAGPFIRELVRRALYSLLNDMECTADAATLRIEGQARSLALLTMLYNPFETLEILLPNQVSRPR